MISHYIFIGFGGAFGAMARVAISHLFPASILGIPAQILFINILGCFCMGLLAEGMALYFSISDNMKYFLISGFLGGFTTFSTFALEFGLLVERNEYILAMSYALLSVFLSITCFFVAMKLVKFLG